MPLVALLALLPVSASAQTIDCAIQWVGEPPAGVVVTLGGPGSDAEGGFCTDQIATGNWVGISNQGEWKTQMRPLAILWPTGRPEYAFNVWTSYDYQSRLFGAAFVEASRGTNGTVEVLYVSEP